MKITIGKIAAGGGVLLFSVTQALGIEGIRISVKCPDVILAWPSVSGETYIVQWRPTLDANTPWVTLTNSLQADLTTNWTSFIHSNVLQCSSGGSGNVRGGAPPAPGMTSTGSDFQATELLVMRVGGSGNTVPLRIYPPGFDLSRFVILVPSTGEWLSGEGYTRALSINSEFNGPMSDGASDNEPPTDPGFYQVVRTGVSLFGLTNGMLLSGIAKVPVEAGYDQGTLSSLTLNANSQPIEGTAMLSQPFSRPLSFVADTRRLVNGDYYLQAVGEWSYIPVDEYDQGYFQFYSPGVLVTISNVITYQDWVQDFRSDLMLINETTTMSNVNWKIDLYGDNQRYVGTFTNHSVDGQISFSWNLTNSAGVGQTDNAFTAVTTLTAPGNPTITDTNPPLVRVVDNYPPMGQWMTARASYIPTTIGNYSLYTNTQNGFAQMGEAGGGVQPGLPFRNPGQTVVLSKATGFTNWGAMYRVFLNHHEVRNFYFDGHGGPDWIGYAGTRTVNQRERSPLRWSPKLWEIIRRTQTQLDSDGYGSILAARPLEHGLKHLVWVTAKTCHYQATYQGPGPSAVLIKMCMAGLNSMEPERLTSRASTTEATLFCLGGSMAMPSRTLFKPHLTSQAGQTINISRYMVTGVLAGTSIIRSQNGLSDSSVLA